MRMTSFFLVFFIITVVHSLHVADTRNQKFLKSMHEKREKDSKIFESIAVTNNQSYLVSC